MSSGLQYFGLKEDQVPLLVIQKPDGEKYLKANIEPAQIAPWLKDYLVYLFFNFWRLFMMIKHFFWIVTFNLVYILEASTLQLFAFQC